jgi:hypothetical protein
MRSKRIVRFALVCLFAGAFSGLVFGLAFGGGGSDGYSAAANDNGVSARSPSTTEPADPFAGQPMTAERAKLIGSNEMGQVLVVVYNNISPEAGSASTRTPDQFRDDLALLWRENFYPINVGDLVTGDIDIPAGKSPVVLTFDRSSIGHYRILDDGTLDPNCAVGIMQSRVAAGYWTAKATFFCLLDVVPNDNEAFGQAERRQEKLRNLVDWGYEVGSNTMTNLDLSAASEDSIRSELAQSQAILKELIGNGYKVSSLSLPYGRYPQSTNLLSSGTWEGTTYQYTAALNLDDEIPCPSPFSTIFSAMRIPRIASAGESLSVAIDRLKGRRELMYISDGDPTSVSAPANLDPSLGQPRTNLGRPLVRY